MSSASRRRRTPPGRRQGANRFPPPDVVRCGSTRPPTPTHPHHPPRHLMRIVGQGLDLIDCRRIEDMLVEHGDAFLRRVYTGAEIDYCGPRARRVEHFAGRFAAKEAVMKAIGTGWRGQVAFTDIEVVRGLSGAPEIRLTGGAAEAARKRGISRVLVSITHLRDIAAASAIAVEE